MKDPAPLCEEPIEAGEKKTHSLSLLQDHTGQNFTNAVETVKHQLEFRELSVILLIRAN